MYFVGSISKVPQRGSFQKGLLDLRRSTVLSFVPQGFSTASLVQRLHRITGRSISRCFKTQKKCWQGRSLRACISCCCQFGCVLAVKNWSYTLYCLLEDFCSEITLRCGPEKLVIQLMLGEFGQPYMLLQYMIICQLCVICFDLCFSWILTDLVFRFYFRKKIDLISSWYWEKSKD